MRDARALAFLELGKTLARRRLADLDSARIVYRRRECNTGFKAGNVREFSRIRRLRVENWVAS